MSTESKLLRYLSCVLSPALLGVMSLAPTGAMATEPCTFSPPLATQTQCLTAIVIPGNGLRSFDISWVDSKRGEYYLADRSNTGIDVIDTHSLKWKRTIGGFVGIVLNSNGAVNNNKSGPDGVTTHGRWLYGGDGNSTLRVYDLDAPPTLAFKQALSTGGTTRLDEMALTTDGKLLIGANNAEDPPFATLFAANGDDDISHVSTLAHITVDPAIMPAGAGLSIEQPAWDPGTQRFYTSLPIIANNPTGCNYGQLTGAPITCDGGVLVTNPVGLSGSIVQGAFNPSTRTGVVALHACGPNGATVGPNENILFGCTPANNPSNVATLVLNVADASNLTQTLIQHITGSDEVWFNAGDGRYYTGSNRDCKVAGSPCPSASQQAAVLGVIDAATNTLIEKVPQSSGSHSVAADSQRNLIFVPQVGTVAAVGAGGDTTTVGSGICGTDQGCIAVYQHKNGGQVAKKN
jgi:hypothetical protein